MNRTKHIGQSLDNQSIELFAVMAHSIYLYLNLGTIPILVAMAFVIIFTIILGIAFCRFKKDLVLVAELVFYCYYMYVLNLIVYYQ